MSTTTTPTRRRRRWSSNSSGGTGGSSSRIRRRVQLAVKSSVAQQLSRRHLQFTEEDDDNGTSAGNRISRRWGLDEALASLYDNNTTSTTTSTATTIVSSSYLPDPNANVDWLLDGSLLHEQEHEEHEMYLKNVLHVDPLELCLKQLEEREQSIIKEEQIQKELESWDAFPAEEKDDDDAMEDENDEFGDFQCADDDEDFSENNKNATSLKEEKEDGSKQQQEQQYVEAVAVGEMDNDDEDGSVIENQNQEEIIGVEEQDEEEEREAVVVNEHHHESSRLPDEDDDDFVVDDEDDTPALVQQVDDILRLCHLSSPPNSNESSVDTPGLVRVVEQMIIDKVTGGDEEEVDEQEEEEVDKQEKEQADTDRGDENGSILVDSFPEVILATPPKIQHVAHHESPPPSLSSKFGSRMHHQDVRSPTLSTPTRIRQANESSTISMSLDENPTSLSLRLPVDDLTTAEARFTLRRQQYYHQEKQQNQPVDKELEEVASTASYSDLPEYYFTKPDLDDTVKVLESLPWDYILPHNGGGSGKGKNDFEPTEFLAIWDDHATGRLCQLDTALLQIQNDSLETIQPHRLTLDRANHCLHEFDQNLRLAFMYWKRSTEAVQHAKGSEEEATGLIGHGILLDLWQQRVELDSLNQILTNMDKIFERERKLLHCIDHFDVKKSDALDEYNEIMQLACEIQHNLDQDLANLSCLDETRSRLLQIDNKFWDRLMSLGRQFIVRCCRRRNKEPIPTSDWLEYEQLVQIILELHSKRPKESACWVDILLSALMYEAERSLTLALLDPFGAERSDYDPELISLAKEIDLHWGDRAKLCTLTHNLVTVRFDFEVSLKYLPGVLRRLCKHLTEILHVFHQVFTWHQKQSEEQCNGLCRKHRAALSRQSHAIEDSFGKLWEHCESLVLKCLDEYLHFSPQLPLFVRSTSKIDDTAWKRDLESLHQTLTLSDMFTSLKYSFTGIAEATQSMLGSCNDDLLTEKLSDLFRRHLRSVHVEAMNSLGRKLANEPWVLDSFASDTEPERTHDSNTTVESIFVGSLIRASTIDTDFKLYKEDTESDSRQPCLSFDAHPFDSEATMYSWQRCCATDLPAHDPIQSSVFDDLSALLGENNGSLQLAPEVVSAELVDWLGHLLAIMQNLPLIVDDVSAVVANLCDLYLTTVFRICAGSARSERLIVGIDAPSALSSIQEEHPSTRVSDENVAAPLFSFRKVNRRPSRSLSYSRRLLLPSYLDAEICAPLLRDESEFHLLRDFITRAQRSLNGVVNLDMVDAWLSEAEGDSAEERACGKASLIAKRETAIWSCAAVAGLLHAFCSIARQAVAFSSFDIIPDDQLAALFAYTQTVLDVAPTLTRCARRISCARALAGSDVVKTIVEVGTGWEECKLHEYSNDYVDEFSDRCSLIWGYMVASGKLPPAALAAAWHEIVCVSYLSLLEGFARVPYCSTEGRALMTLDLASFTAGISSASVADRLESVLLVSKPPIANPDIDSHYVDTYIKVFYYPKEDVLHWIAENHRNYRLNHALALATAAAAGSPEHSPESTLSDLLEHVEMFYRPKAKALPQDDDPTTSSDEASGDEALVIARV